MSIQPVTKAQEKVADLQAQLDAAKEELRVAEDTKESDPVVYLARLVYANAQVYGSYGYEYGNFGDTEIKRAQQVLDIVGGDVTIAERVITELHIR